MDVSKFFIIELYFLYKDNFKCILFEIRILYGKIVMYKG